MNTFTHLLLGKAVYEQLSKQGILLNKKAFLWGNLKPDFTTSLLYYPHTANFCRKKINQGIWTLSQVRPYEITTPWYGERLGILCHFMADYFCFVHNEGFTGSRRQHMWYESRQHMIARRHIWPALSVSSPPYLLSANIILHKIHSQHRLYCSRYPDMKQDLDQAFLACFYGVRSIYALCREQMGCKWSMRAAN
jgi:hypothetical protein